MGAVCTARLKRANSDPTPFVMRFTVTEGNQAEGTRI